MGRRYEENPRTLETLLKRHRIAQPGGMRGEYVEVGNGWYTVGMLAEALQSCTQDHMKERILPKLASRFMAFHREGNEHCRIITQGSEELYLVEGPWVQEFLMNGLKKHVRSEDAAMPSTYERWKTPYTGSCRQQRNYRLHQESVEELVQAGAIIHLQVIDDQVVLPQGQCDEAEFLEKIRQVSGRVPDSKYLESRQHEFYREKAYTIYYELLGPPHEVRALPTAKAVELLPRGFERFYLLEDRLAPTG